MHERMQYHLIEGQGQGHEPFEVGNLAIFNSYLLHHLQWELATGREFLNSGTICKFRRAGFLGRLLQVDLIKPVSDVHPYVRPSTESFFDFNEIWYVGRGRRLMHDGMQYDPNQGQDQGHEPLKVGNSAIFKGYRLPHLQWVWQVTTDS